MRAQCQFLVTDPNGHTRRCGNVLLVPDTTSLVLCHAHVNAPKQAFDNRPKTVQWVAKPLPTRSNPHPAAYAHGNTATLAEAKSALSRSLVHLGIPDRMCTQIAHKTEPTWTDFPEYKLTTVIRVRW